MVVVMANKNNTHLRTRDSEHADRATELQSDRATELQSYSEMKKVWKATLRVTVQGKIRHWPSK